MLALLISLSGCCTHSWQLPPAEVPQALTKKYSVRREGLQGECGSVRHALYFEDAGRNRRVWKSVLTAIVIGHDAVVFDTHGSGGRYDVFVATDTGKVVNVSSLFSPRLAQEPVFYGNIEKDGSTIELGISPDGTDRKFRVSMEQLLKFARQAQAMAKRVE
jgi:hypothetical protein